jgi:hypothetical protein
MFKWGVFSKIDLFHIIKYIFKNSKCVHYKVRIVVCLFQMDLQGRAGLSDLKNLRYFIIYIM